MTSLVAWHGVDSRAPSSLYIAADSRISWAEGGRTLATWDHGQKVFAASALPAIFGYAGNASFVAQALAKIVALIDRGLFLSSVEDHDECAYAVFHELQRILGGVDPNNIGPTSILYGSRINRKLFGLSVLETPNGSRFQARRIQLPPTSSLVYVNGSGGKYVQREFDRWHTTSSASTSRAVFSAFCDALHKGNDTLSGGPPQLVGLNRKDPGQAFGVFWRGLPYALAVEASNMDRSSISWFNDLFERCDPISGKRLPKAQRHKRPFLRESGKSVS